MEELYLGEESKMRFGYRYITGYYFLRGFTDERVDRGARRTMPKIDYLTMNQDKFTRLPFAAFKK